VTSTASSPPSARWLSPLEQRAWRAFVAVSSVVMAELENELEAAHGLSLGEYAVLVELSEVRDVQEHFSGEVFRFGRNQRIERGRTGRGVDYKLADPPRTASTAHSVSAARRTIW